MGRAHEVRKAAMAETAAKKTKLYSKYGKLISNLAKTNQDPNSNPALKKMIDRAKKEQVPADVIKRALDKASSSSAEAYQEVVYEILGPAGSMFLVECMTDNPNRSISDIRSVINKTKVKQASVGSILHLFNRYGVIIVKGADSEELELKLLETDFPIEKTVVEETEYHIYVNVMDLTKLSDFLGDGYVTEEKIIYEASDVVDVSDDEYKTIELLLKLLNEIEDVQEIYHNLS